MFVSPNMFDRRQTGIVRGHDEHALQEIFEPEYLAGLEPEVNLMGARRGWADGNQIFQAAPLKDHERRHDLRQTRG
jgi:hypothetical protein